MKSKADQDWNDFVLDQLRDVPGLAARPMFGALGLYAGARFFGILWRGQLFFKTTGVTRPKYEQRGSGPFRPSATQTLRNYYEVPAEVLEDRETLVGWAREAIALEDERRRVGAQRKSKRSRD